MYEERSRTMRSNLGIDDLGDTRGTGSYGMNMERERTATSNTPTGKFDMTNVQIDVNNVEESKNALKSNLQYHYAQMLVLKNNAEWADNKYISKQMKSIEEHYKAVGGVKELKEFAGKQYNSYTPEQIKEITYH